jgi:ABC-type nitrate/sulfonate/bicarbonate transport system substrate-binding protein
MAHRPLAGIRRRRALRLTAGIGAALVSSTSHLSAQGSSPKLGMVSFPTGNSAHSKIWIRHNQLDQKYGWLLDWEVRNTVEAYYGDFNTGVYPCIDLAGLNVLANLYNKGVPFQMVQASFSQVVPLVARADANIRTVADLKGKRIGSDRTSFISAYLRAYLRTNGLDIEKDVQFVNVNLLQALPRLQRGDFDAATLQLEHILPVLQAGAKDLVIFAEIAGEFAKALGVSRTYQYMAVRRDWLAANPAVVPAVMKSYADMAAFIKSDTAAAVALLEPAPGKGGAGLPKELGMVSYGTGIAGGRTNIWTSIPVAEIKLQIRAELAFYKEIGFIEKVPDDGFFFNG